ncbi:heavy metal-associated isoprenylated plant protein 39-like [Cicer arietinum]|uniref:Heavy metal-associated isoprenylated plant protein 39-like n=1 Tax=Cicer arietinum TaxID=3827 RepID=A0A1S2Z4Y6_CICAR|nr:heavy metal-associated isoprenylated plant protein 39-like [Cicer arietinum]
MKKVVLKVGFYNDRIKQKVMKTASGLLGVESVSIELKEKKLTLSGDIDPVKAVTKLRKLCQTELVSVEPLKEDKKSTDVSTNLNSLESYPFYYHMYPPPYIGYYI